VPNKLVGVVLMLLAIIWLSALVFDVSIIRSNTFKPFNRTLLALGFFAFVALISLGAKHIEYPYILLGQLITIIYFGALLIMVPASGLIENALLNDNGNLTGDGTSRAHKSSPLVMPSGRRGFSTSSSLNKAKEPNLTKRPVVRKLPAELRYPGLDRVKQHAYYTELSPYMRNRLNGIMLSDGHLAVTSSSSNARLSFAQSAAENRPGNRAYFGHVHRDFKPLMTDAFQDPQPVSFVSGQTGQTYHKLSFLTVYAPSLLPFHRAFYRLVSSNNRWIKVIPDNIGQIMTPQTLADLISGNGGVLGGKTSITPGVEIAMQGFIKPDLLRLRDAIRDMGLLCTLTNAGCLHILVSSVPLLRTMVKDLMPSAMWYKLGLDQDGNPIVPQITRPAGSQPRNLAHENANLPKLPLYMKFFGDIDRYRFIVPLNIMEVLNAEWLAYMVMRHGIWSKGGLYLSMNTLIHDPSARIRLIAALHDMFGIDMRYSPTKRNGLEMVRFYLPAAQALKVQQICRPHMAPGMGYKIGLPDQ
jgi:hypothetical protein